MYLDAFKVEFEKEINSKLSTMQEDIKTLKGSSKIDKVEELLDDRIENKSKSLEKVVDVKFKRQNEEMIEHDKRKDNIVLFNAEEATTILKDERVKHDIKLFTDLCSACEVYMSPAQIISTTSLGKKKEDGTPRLLVIKLCDNSIKRTVLRNVNKAKSLSDDRLNNIRVNHHPTANDRIMAKQLYEEPKTRQQNDTSGDFCYKVRGPTWDMKIVKLKKRE